MLGIRHYRNTAIDLYQGDITSFVCDGIVNAANESLLGGGGVDGAIHRAGGPSILDECQRIGHCSRGKAVATTAGALPASKVLHTVGPVWKGGHAGEAALLRSCIHECLKLASALKLHHVAFPAISTGAYGYPIEQAAQTSLTALKEYLTLAHDAESRLRRLTFVLHDGTAYRAFQDALFVIFSED